MSSYLAPEDSRALAMLRRINYSPNDHKKMVRAVTVLGSDLYALAEELSGNPDGADEEWLSEELLTRVELELLSPRRVGGWANMASYVDTLMAGDARKVRS